MRPETKQQHGVLAIHGETKGSNHFIRLLLLQLYLRPAFVILSAIYSRSVNADARALCEYEMQFVCAFCFLCAPFLVQFGYRG
jgi:hypothetical protein